MQQPSDASLRQRLADLGVGLFRPSTRVRVPSVEELAGLVEQLVSSENPRLNASLPCLFVLHDEVAPEAARRAAAAVDAAGVERLGLCWRLARAFAIQWEPDVVHVLGRPRRLPALPFEPAGLPDPEEDLGERCPAVARDVYDDARSGNPVIDLVDTFRTWLRQSELERAPVRGA